MADDLKHLNLKKNYFYVFPPKNIDLALYDGENANQNKYALGHIDMKSWKVLYYQRNKP